MKIPNPSSEPKQCCPEVLTPPLGSLLLTHASSPPTESEIHQADSAVTGLTLAPTLTHTATPPVAQNFTHNSSKWLAASQTKIITLIDAKIFSILYTNTVVRHNKIQKLLARTADSAPDELEFSGT